MRVVLICQTCERELASLTNVPNQIMVPLCPVCSERIADSAHAEGYADACAAHENA